VHVDKIPGMTPDAWPQAGAEEDGDFRASAVFLAEHATVAEKKLYLLGGVLDWWDVSELPAVVPICAIGLLNTVGDVAGTTFNFRFRVFDPQGNELQGSALQTITVEPCDTSFVVATMQVEVNQYGRYRFEISVNDRISDAAAARLEVVPKRRD
jgi:hypothetical protein